MCTRETVLVFLCLFRPSVRWLRNFNQQKAFILFAKLIFYLASQAVRQEPLSGSEPGGDGVLALSVFQPARQGNALRSGPQRNAGKTQQKKKTFLSLGIVRPTMLAKSGSRNGNGYGSVGVMVAVDSGEDIRYA
uniref:HDC13006 n=1 Tax=Drosophila melanogaster TaxID=7227 RepID=Q6IKA8_DROME|nr:TPA_inf: HDC13006 [Drosophila melanogaster]